MTGAGLIKFENASKRSRKSRSNKIVGSIIYSSSTNGFWLQIKGDGVVLVFKVESWQMHSRNFTKMVSAKIIFLETVKIWAGALLSLTFLKIFNICKTAHRKKLRESYEPVLFKSDNNHNSPCSAVDSALDF